MTSSTVGIFQKSFILLILIFTALFVLSSSVFADDIPVTSIEDDTTDINLVVGKSMELLPNVLPEDATDKTLIFTSADTDVVTVENNVITAVAEGTTQVTAKWQNDENINLIYNITTITGSIAFDIERIYTNVGENVTPALTLTPQDLLLPEEIVYTSSNPNVATVDSGVVTPLLRGTTTITASSADGTYYNTIDIVVSGISITTNVDALELTIDDTHALNTEVLADPSIIDTYTYSWTSSTESIATVAEDGTVTCVSTGEAVITVTCNENPSITASTTIKVCGIQLNTYILNIYTGNDIDLIASIITNKDVADPAIIWSSSDLSVATVSNGVVTTIAPGSCMITASNTETGYMTSCSINISSYSLESNIYNVDRSLKSIVNVGANTNFAQFIANLRNFSFDIVITYNDGSVPTGDIILSGMKANLIVNGETKDSLTIIVNGDINNDGKVTIADYALLKLHILNLKKIDKQYNLVSADANFDNAISIADYSLIRLDILNIKKLNDGLNALPAISNDKVKKFVETALSQYGKPYSWGDEGPDKFDCSGLVYYCLAENGYSLIRSTAHNYSNYSEWETISKDNLQAGDLMFFQSDSNPAKIGHVGIYLNDGYFIHASGSFSNVVISKFEGYYDTMFTHGKRVYQ